MLLTHETTLFGITQTGWVHREVKTASATCKLVVSFSFSKFHFHKINYDKTVIKNIFAV